MVVSRLTLPLFVVIAIARPTVTFADDPSKAPASVARLSRVMDAKVKIPNGKQMGHVDDLVFAIDKAEVRYVVVSDGGVIGLADKLFAVPWAGLRFDKQGEEQCVVIDVSEEEFRKAPGFNKDNWPSFGNRKWSPKSRNSSSNHSENPSQKSAADAPIQGKSDELLWRGGQIDKLPVKAAQGRVLLSLKDLIIDEATGEILYVAVGVESDGEARMLIAPCSTVRLAEKSSSPLLVIPLSAEQIQEAPSFAVKAWPLLNDSEWRAKVDDYYADFLSMRASRR